MKKEASLTTAILKGKCPRCRKGNVFPVPLMSFKKLTAVNQTCPNCGVELVPEPDFYYGAMYISYALSVALFITVMVVLNFLFNDPELMVYIVSVLFFNLILLPLMLRISKVLYLYGLGKISYEPDKG
ncbi:DUF983 domain-containing protein [Cyclobacterium sp.]|uniref:DUF983 domain-containing protein n=1 Tax=Cyclobacterium sp. TaxID=1966343 RepID=UPI0019B3FF73|nr:DUF983 domain-containing protein [Cyclobacterium sp.]MBD3627203.1 DUF983 domain-containing protein [Cyclobacterium sp.]